MNFCRGKEKRRGPKSTPKQKRKAPRQKKKKKRRKDKEATRELNFDGRRDTLHNKIQYIWLDIYKNKFLYIKSPKYMYMQLEREESGVPKKKRKRRRKRDKRRRKRKRKEETKNKGHDETPFFSFVSARHTLAKEQRDI